jgi:lipoate-protein ligase A
MSDSIVSQILERFDIKIDALYDRFESKSPWVIKDTAEDLAKVVAKLDRALYDWDLGLNKEKLYQAVIDTVDVLFPPEDRDELKKEIMSLDSREIYDLAYTLSERLKIAYADFATHDLYMEMK